MAKPSKSGEHPVVKELNRVLTSMAVEKPIERRRRKMREYLKAYCDGSELPTLPEIASH